MIKKIIKLYWHEAEDTTQERLEKEYKRIKEDFVVIWDWKSAFRV